MTPTALQAPAVNRAGRWVWLPKPLFTAWVLGCVVSMLDSRALTLGRVLPATLTWSLVPALEILALAAVWRLAPRPVGFARAVDRFCGGNLAWWLLLIAFAACWRELAESWWLALAAAVALSTAVSDYRFFRDSLASPSPLRDLAVERALAWIPGILLFGGGSLWPGILERLQ